ncbi:VanW family protein [Patescibacteria group bacterium]|nr:VanW family protein [Patescibacteria group bacterium]
MRRKKKRRAILPLILIITTLCIGITAIATVAWYYWHSYILYKNRVFPAVVMYDVSFGGKTQQEVADYWLSKNTEFSNAIITLAFENHIATLSATTLNFGYDATLSATQAYVVGRSPYFFSNINDRLFKKKIDLSPVFQWDKEAVQTAIADLSEQINIPSQDALFQFAGGKVTAFRPSKDGQAVNEKELTKLIEASMPHIAAGNLKEITIPIPVEPVKPKATTTDVNTFGIKELIGRGYSQFGGSIPGRIHNIALAASKLNGVLIKPGETFSFNQTLGDISAATGYQSAYIIKEGRTVMGDGGGVCQVSTTLFRAALNAGLPITERHEHSYRVHYYEDGGFKAGLDATVFDPKDDLKFKNDTPSYILIQTITDTDNVTLTFELYGTSDGRKAEILNHQVWGVTAPPPDLYQDDPTLPKGTVKQVDFAAWGAKASFQYKVVRNGETIINQTFTSNYRPWQAVFLRGTKE